MENKDTFNYTYSAGEQDEVKKIRSKYLPREKSEDKMAELRRLDTSVTNKATAVSLIVGVIGALVMGFGMSLVMSELGEWMFSSHLTAMAVGVVLGAVGIALVCLAYPVYNRTLKREREKAAPEIIRLSDELMK